MLICLPLQPGSYSPQCGLYKMAALPNKALSSIDRQLDPIQMFHTARRSDFKNKLFDEALGTFTMKDAHT